MSTWIQIELPVEGNVTGALQLDLSRVNRVEIGRENGELANVRLVYNQNERLELSLPTALAFLREWENFIKDNSYFQFKEPEAEPGLIAVATDMPAGLTTHRVK